MLGIEKAVKYFGTQTILAEALGVRQEHISMVKRGKRRLTVQHAMRIEELTNGEVTRAELRPDVWSKGE